MYLAVAEVNPLLVVMLRGVEQAATSNGIAANSKSKGRDMMDGDKSYEED